MVDLSTLASFAVAATTSALAFVTYLMSKTAKRSMEDGRRQLSLLAYQTAVFRSEQDPYLKVEDFNFVGNKLTLTIQNVGEGRANLFFVRARKRYSAVTRCLKLAAVKYRT